MINKTLIMCWIITLFLTLIVCILDYLVVSIQTINFLIYVNISWIELLLPSIIMTLVVLIVFIIKLSNLGDMFDAYCQKRVGT